MPRLWRRSGGPWVIAFIFISSASWAAEHRFTAAQRNYWAFQPVHRPPVPSLRDASSVRTPIDAFVIAKLEEKGLRPDPVADQASLIRRATMDLTGLPPTPEEVREFLADASPRSFERVVDRLLSSPHYGERWARHWLDLARYAESEGFKSDETRPNAWRYRDYVIKAFNSDLPYDRFIREQIAGDELWPDDPEARVVATAFNRHYPDESNARNLRQRRQEILNDITDTVGAVFTGLTYGCARCHDHKYDPILQADYYRLQAFFANTAAADDVPLVTQERQLEYEMKLAAWEEKTKDIRAEIEKIEKPHRDAIIKDYVDKYPDEIQAALKKPAPERSPFECQMVAKAELYISPKSHQYIGREVGSHLKGKEKERWISLKEQLKSFDSLKPSALPKGTGIEDLGVEAPKMFVLRRGNFDAPEEEVQPGFLTLLDPKPAVVRPIAGIRTTGRRAALANILADPKNPLTARVIVNRIWHYHFGKGLVSTPSDFGVKGDPPTHPALLDWLASEFVENGWSLKKMHRLIMLSRVYQQSSASQEAALKADPDDKLWWRYPRHRLEGEVIRDSALNVAGLLNPKMGGPSIFPELPPGMPARGGWPVTHDKTEQNRRSIYIFVRRNTRFPMFESFDMPDTHESCSRRNVTVSPLQALMLMNSSSSLEWAEGFAAKVIQSAGADWQAQVRDAYARAYSRSPTAAEQQIIRKFFEREEGILQQRLAAGETPPLPQALPEKTDRAEAAALVDFCHMLLNSNEFVYLN